MLCSHWCRSKWRSQGSLGYKETDHFNGKLISGTVSAQVASSDSNWSYNTRCHFVTCTCFKHRQKKLVCHLQSDHITISRVLREFLLSSDANTADPFFSRWTSIWSNQSWWVKVWSAEMNVKRNSNGNKTQRKVNPAHDFALIGYFGGAFVFASAREAVSKTKRLQKNTTYSARE